MQSTNTFSAVPNFVSESELCGTQSANVTEAQSGKQKPDWPQLMILWEKGSLTQAEFCQQHGVKYKQFLKKRTELRKQLASAVRSKLRPAKITSSSTVTQSYCEYTLLLGCGRKLVIPHTYEPSSLKQLLVILEGC